VDWIGVYAVGAPDTSDVTQFYTSGRASDRTLTVLPAALPTGSYELRLFANDTLTRLATSNAFAVAAGPSVSASPVTVPAGGTLTVTWAGIATPTATDWVTLVPLNAADASWVAWSYTTGAASGSLGLAIPATVPTGTYELRLFAQNGWQRLALSNTVTVGPTLAVTPTPVAPGGTVTVTWAGIPTPTPTDWLALVPLNAPDTSYVAWVSLNGRAGDRLLFVLPPALPAGPYDVRLFANNGWQRLAVSNVVTVTAPGPTLAVSPVAVVAGSALTVDWHGIAAPTATDWIGVYAVGAPDASYVTRGNTNGLASGTTTLGLPGGLATGAYDLRLFANNTFTRLAVSNGLAVVAGPVVRVTPATLAATGTLTVTWEGIAAPTPTDWVALVLLNAPDPSYVAWGYTTGAATGSLGLSVPAAVPQGSYELRLFAQNTWQRLAVSNVVTITP
jgi:large repetitive protein